MERHHLKVHISFLLESMKGIDNNPTFSMKYYEMSGKCENVIFHNLNASIVRVSPNIIEPEMHKQAREIYLFLDGKWHSNTWPCHDVHFHKNFGDYVDCPYTCANEVVECLEKIYKENFAHVA